VTKWDCRKDGRDPSAVYFPCEVRVIDPQTGERMVGVFFLCDAPAQVGRFISGADGLPLVHPRRKKRWVDNGRGGKKIEVYYDRLESWEQRPWVALRLHKDGTTGEVVAKSEGCL
jgi:hypothetical protein